MAIDDNTSYELTGYQVKDLASKIRAKADSNSLASVATSGLYSDLTGAPTIPTVYNGTLTIQQNGTTLGTFSANQDTNETINITGGGSSGTIFYQGTSGDVVTLYSDQAKTQVATAQDVADAITAGATYISYGVDELASVVFCLPVPGATGQYLFRATSGTFVMELIATSTTTFVQSNINIQEELNAGSNISISGNTISATDTTYSDFTGASSSTAGANGLVPAPAAGDEGKALHGDGTWKDTTAKLVEMSYGESNAWAKFIAAYNAGSIVYCRASSNANPATGSQTRKAFMAYVSNATSPTSVEFQYVRSQSSKTDSQQFDQVFVYKLTNASGGTWTVESRNMGPKIVAGTGMSSTFTTGANATITLNADTMTGATSGAAGTAGVVPAPAAGDNTKFLRGDGTWQTLMNAFYPVGSIYMSATLATAADVEAALGGTWTAWGAGRVPVGVDTNDTDFDTAEETGGEKTHTLSTGEIPAHTHGSKSLTGSFGGVLFDDGVAMTATGICSMSDKRARSWSGSEGNASKTVNINATHTHDSVGSGQAHNNLQPYITCYMYKRTA